MIREALAEYEKNRLGRPVDDRCKRVILPLLQEAQEQAMDNFYLPIYEVIEQAAPKVFFTSGANELLNENTYELAESQYFKTDLVRHLMKPSTYRVRAACFVKRLA